jgi:radical SAM/Cys-rich protein
MAESLSFTISTLTKRFQMPQASTSLKFRDLPLANAHEQRKVLTPSASIPAFAHTVQLHQTHALHAGTIDILQVNVGKLCNMTCRHCHVDAGPDRREIMTRETIDQCLSALMRSEIQTLDLTGGAPEMNPHFRYFITEARRLGVHVIDRCNLTILLAKGYEDLPEFLAKNQVEVVASLPCYLAENTDSQRGDGAYRQSISAIQRLNDLGYGKADSGLILTLVYNPIGPSLPPDQQQLESQYRSYLHREHGLEFTRLFTITNMPISRFLEDLLDTGRYDEYMTKLIDAFNPASLDGLMCHHTLSVGWDGTLYDCDFNQMLDLPICSTRTRKIKDFQPAELSGRPIVVNQHCYGCTAGKGSSCQGALA